MKNLLRFALVCAVLSSCSRVKPMSAKEQARLAAMDAISRAEKMITSCADNEVDVADASSLLDESKAAMDNDDYLQAKEKADAAYDMAKKALDEAEAARKKALAEAEKEYSGKLPGSYQVGRWEITRDCLWNIAKKKKIYGDPWEWKKIYIANKYKIKDPDIIYPGQIFDIPR